MVHCKPLRPALLVLTLLSACAAADPGGGAPVPTSDSVAGLFLAGRQAAMQNDMVYASRAFMRAMQLDRSSPELKQQAFMASLMAGRPEAVELARGEPETLAAQLLLGDAEAAQGRWDEARKRYAALPAQGIGQVLQPLLIAWAEQGAGHTDAALAILQPLTGGAHFPALYTLHAALIADLAGRYDQAGTYYRTATTQFGALNLQLARYLASFQMRQGRPVEASQTLRALASTTPDLNIALPALEAQAGRRQIRNAADGIAAAYLEIAAALRAQEASELSMVLLRLALDLNPELTPARLLAAEITAEGRRPAAALPLLAGIKDDDPLAPIASLRRAVIEDKAGDTEGAMRQLEQLARKSPGRPEPLVLEGDLLRAAHRYDAAVAAYDRAVALVHPPTRADWPLFYDRGIALDRAHKWDRAEADFHKALSLAPDQPYVLNYLGYSWTEQHRNLPQARRMIERALEQRPNDGAIMDSLGWVVLRQGDVRSAVKLLERASEMTPEDATVNGHLGDAYWAVGRRLEAQYQWRRALTMSPEPDERPKLEAKLREADRALGAPGKNATTHPASP
jgi:tetratricopeptide (TPR) repeat protein